MSVHHRNTTATESDALYQPVSQVEYSTAGPEPNTELQLEEDDDALAAEDFVAHEHAVSYDKRIGWIHFILGSAVLLPWNGLSAPRVRLCRLTRAGSNHYRNTLLSVEG